jgi:translation initiation factor 2B subunit (eIF-2B alpha/beta/delta family)
VEGSLVTARKTALVLRQVIAAERKPAPYLASQLIELVKNYGRKLIAANPTGGFQSVNLVGGNILSA